MGWCGAWDSPNDYEYRKKDFDSIRLQFGYNIVVLDSDCGI